MMVICCALLSIILVRVHVSQWLYSVCFRVRVWYDVSNMVNSVLISVFIVGGMFIFVVIL